MPLLPVTVFNGVPRSPKGLLVSLRGNGVNYYVRLRLLSFSMQSSRVFSSPQVPEVDPVQADPQ